MDLQLQRGMAAGSIRPWPAANVAAVERIASAIAGAALVLPALVRASPGRIALAAAGLVLLQRGLTGRCYVYDFFGVDTAPRRPPSDALDPVLCASEDSFPASDPPAWIPVTGPRA